MIDFLAHFRLLLLSWVGEQDFENVGKLKRWFILV
jgi:hypothetical protein